MAWGGEVIVSGSRIASWNAENWMERHITWAVAGLERMIILELRYAKGIEERRGQPMGSAPIDKVDDIFFFA